MLQIKNKTQMISLTNFITHLKINSTNSKQFLPENGRIKNKNFPSHFISSE